MSESECVQVVYRLSMSVVWLKIELSREVWHPILCYNVLEWSDMSTCVLFFQYLRDQRVGLVQKQTSSSSD
jgi:hypothetical protein